MQAKPLQLANTLIERAALGKGLKSPISIDPFTKDFETTEGADNVKQCVIDLITTRVGERVMNEDFGTHLPPLLFENIDGLIDILPVHVIEVLTRFEPRIFDVQARAVRYAETTINLQISWTVKATGRRDNLTYPFYTEPLEGGTK